LGEDHGFGGQARRVGGNEHGVSGQIAEHVPGRVRSVGTGADRVPARGWLRNLLGVGAFCEHVNLFRDLARAETPVVGLRAMTGGRPSLSPLYASFMRPRGFEDELRAVFRVGGRPWGQLSLFRATDGHISARSSTPLECCSSTPSAA
jgi:hypothetical protein